jgi:serine/threonine protein kinase
MIGKRILSYEIKQLVGKGGMGNVYLAVHVTSGERVAIKSLLPELVRHDHIRERFKKEAETMSLLPHANIVKLIGYKEDGEGAYIIMEFIEGRELDNYIRTQSGPIPSDVAIPMMKQILSAFSFAHDNGVVHRDIKPSNIFITKEGQIKITDFGIAKVLSEADKKLTKTGIQMGTVYYMSPEQVRGKAVDRRSDIYSLGVTFFQMVTGRSPYESMTTEYEVYTSIVNEPLPSVTSIYPGALKQLDLVISKATAKDPGHRFNDCAQFSQVLSDALAAKPDVIDKKEDGETKKDETSVKKQPQVVVPPKKSKIGLTVSILFGVIILVLGGWQCNVKSQYKKLIEKAGQERDLQLYYSAILSYDEADEKRKSLFIGGADEDITHLKGRCYFEMYKKQGEDNLNSDTFYLSVSNNYVFSATSHYSDAQKYDNDSMVSDDNFLYKRLQLCAKIQQGIDYELSNNYTQSNRAYDEAITYAREINAGDTVIAHLNKAKSNKSPEIRFVDTWVVYNVYNGGVKGMMVHYKLDINFMKDKECNLVLWFYTEAGDPIKDKNGTYRTVDYQVSTSKLFTPEYDRTNFTDLSVFMPYDELEVDTGDLKFNAAVFYGSQKISPNSNYYSFRLYDETK